ncbi:MAG TPA: hypothetical protein VMM56_14590 [Planctomycetaceae bacterium]|nr:hypothetical protein [Planctomycetaceae bacterium]
MLKKTIPILIASFVGFFLILSKFSPGLEEWDSKVSTWFDIVAAFAMVLGATSLLSSHFKKISNKKPGWAYSLITIVAFGGTLIVGLGKIGVPPSFPGYPWSGDYMTEGGAFWWVFNYVYVPLAATMFATLAFYISSAAFRAFRAKNVEASLLLITAVVVLLAQTSSGPMLTEGLPDEYAHFKLENIKGTLINLFNTLGTRAIMIGIALGVVSTSLKVLLGVDRSYLGAD